MLKSTRTIFLTVLASLVLLEIGVRWLFPLPPLEGLDRALYSPLLQVGVDSSLSHASFEWVSEPDDASSLHQLNLYGFRDRDWPLRPSAGRDRVLVVGDSMVEGFLAHPRATVPAAFERTSRSLGWSIETLNLGVGGAGAGAYSRLLRDAATALSADAALVVLYANDFRETQGGAPRGGEVRRRAAGLRLASILRSAVADRPVARRWHAKPELFLAAVPDARNPWSDEGFRRRAAAFVEPRLATAMQEGRFNPHLTDMGRRFERLLRKPADLSPILSTLQSELGREVELRFAYLPSKLQVSDHYLDAVAQFSGDPMGSLLAEEYQAQATAFLGWCAELSLLCTDLTPLMRRADRDGQRLYWSYDDHLSPFGYQWVGEQLARWWQAANQPLPDASALARAADEAL